MGEILVFVIFFIPAILGVAEICHSLKVYIISSKKKARKYIVIFLSTGNSYEQLLSAVEEMYWHGKKYAEKIIAVDCGMDMEEYKICLEISREKNVIFCKNDDLKDILLTLSKC